MRVAYSVGSSWNGGFTAEVRLKNTGSAAVNGWKTGFALKGDEKVTDAWSATVTQSGAEVTAANAAHNAAVPPGGTASFGFQARGTATGAPDAFTLNGRTCTT
ncbi:cellulose binding domain-containing protein [Streptomyces sp. HMX87]|uniref:cellulose binding domain-containing protein n=1 Tax=Streptomyces sp. HMX87 TaxID=3390849 RepID=UPI003A8B8ECD